MLSIGSVVRWTKNSRVSNHKLKLQLIRLALAALLCDSPSSFNFKPLVLTSRKHSTTLQKPSYISLQPPSTRGRPAANWSDEMLCLNQSTALLDSSSAGATAGLFYHVLWIGFVSLSWAWILDPFRLRSFLLFDFYLFFAWPSDVKAVSYVSFLCPCLYVLLLDSSSTVGCQWLFSFYSRST